MRRIANTRTVTAVFLAVFLALLLPAVMLAQTAGDEATPDPDTANCVLGTVWYDGNLNGVRDANEDVMDGARVHLFGVGPFELRPGLLWLANSDLTRDGGYFEMCNVRPGTYYLQVNPPQSVLQDRLMVTYGANPTAPFEFARGDSVTASFGFGAPHVYEGTAVLPIPRR